MCRFSNIYVSESIWTIGLDFFLLEPIGLDFNNHQPQFLE